MLILKKEISRPEWFKAPRDVFYIKVLRRKEKRKKTMMKKGHILHWAMGVVTTPLLGSCAADDIGDAGATPALPEASAWFWLTTD